MTEFSTLTREDWELYLLRLIFGSEADPLVAVVKRAYLDFSRTLHGFSRLSAKEELRNRAIIAVKESVRDLKSILRTSVKDETFDAWHETACHRLAALYDEYGHHLFVGQSQKWLNMTLKYVFTFGEDRLSGFSGAYPHCHVPLDNVILDKLVKYNFPAFRCPWSRLDDYDEYLARQKWMRQRFSIPPLDVEFLLWMGKEVG